MQVLLNNAPDTTPLDVGDVLWSKLWPHWSYLAAQIQTCNGVAPNPVQTLPPLLREGLWVLAGVPSHLGQQRQLCAI